MGGACGEGRHKACPYRRFEGVMEWVASMEGEGRHEACPYRRFEGVMEGVARVGRAGTCPWGLRVGGQAQGLPLPEI